MTDTVLPIYISVFIVSATFLYYVISPANEEKKQSMNKLESSSEAESRTSINSIPDAEPSSEFIQEQTKEIIPEQEESSESESDMSDFCTEDQFNPLYTKLSEICDAIQLINTRIDELHERINMSHVSPIQLILNIDSTLTERVSEAIVTEAIVTEATVTEATVTEAQIKEAKVQEDQVIEEKVQEDQVIEEKVQEDQVTEEKVQEDQVTEEKVIEEKVKEDQVTEAKVQEEQLKETKIIVNSEMNESMLIQSTETSLSESLMAGDVSESLVDSTMNDYFLSDSSLSTSSLSESQITQQCAVIIRHGPNKGQHCKNKVKDSIYCTRHKDTDKKE